MEHEPGRRLARFFLCQFLKDVDRRPERSAAGIGLDHPLNRLEEKGASKGELPRYRHSTEGGFWSHKISTGNHRRDREAA